MLLAKLQTALNCPVRPLRPRLCPGAQCRAHAESGWQPLFASSSLLRQHFGSEGVLVSDIIECPPACVCSVFLNYSTEVRHFFQEDY